MSKFKSMSHTIFQAFLVSIILGVLFNFVKPFGMFIAWGSAYLVGFAVAKIITKNEGFLIRRRFGVLLGCMVFISMCYNPILLYIVSSKIGLYNAILIFSSNIFNLFNIVSVVLTVWASVRHLKF